MLRRLELAADRVDRILVLLCSAILAIMVVIIAMLVVTRNFLGFSFPWSEELTRYLMIWLVFLGSASLVWRDDHIAMTVLPGALSTRARAGLMLGIRAGILAVLGLLIQQSMAIVGLRHTIRAAALGVPLSWVYVAIPVGASLMVFFAAIRSWQDARVFLGRTN